MGLTVVRGDFQTWIPLESIFGRFLNSFNTRLGTKIIADFTGTMQMRHPYDLRGLLLYNGHFDDSHSMFVFRVPISEVRRRRGSGRGFSSEQVYGGLGALALVQMCIFSAFMFTIPSTHWMTFWSTLTGSQF